MKIDSDIHELADDVVSLLKQGGFTVSVAESCTAGLLSAAITDISGSSDVFDGGFITYSNESKSDILGVFKETLEAYGAVSAETAHEMALQCLKKMKTDISISITGIAGPKGGTKTKPVGTVWFGMAYWVDMHTDPVCVTHHSTFKGTRQDIRKAAVFYALNLLKDKCRANLKSD